MWAEATYDELLGLGEKECFEWEDMSHEEVKAVGVIPSHFVYTAKFTSLVCLLSSTKQKYD